MHRVRLWLVILLLSHLMACAVADSSTEQSRQVLNAPRLTILDSYVLAPTEVNGLGVNELSDLAWDADEQLLYAVSDKGRLYHLTMTLSGDKISVIKPIFAANLLNPQGEVLQWRDSEGLHVARASNGRSGDSQIIIALEGLPRLGVFNPLGQMQALLPLHKDLQDRHQYRHSNTSLESVTWHPRYGFLTAPEQALKADPVTQHALYSAQHKWTFPAYPAKNSAVTALLSLPNEAVLVLERAWSGILNPMVNSLRYLDLKQCQEYQCPVQDLYVSSSLFMVDNFEGLTHIKDDIYMMVSDDSAHDLQRTVFVLFRLEGVK